MASIEDLKSVVNAGQGFADATQYLVQMPEIPGSDLSAYERNALCRVTRLPGRQILTTQRDVGIMKQQMGIGYAVADIGLSFHVLNDYKTKRYFDAWHNLIVDQNTQQIKFADNYKKTVKIYQLKKGVGFQVFNKDFRLFGVNFNFDFDVSTSESIIYGVELEGAFPITVNGIDLTDASNDQPVEISIDLSYKNWKQIA